MTYPKAAGAITCDDRQPRYNGRWPGQVVRGGQRPKRFRSRMCLVVGHRVTQGRKA